jgi:hypothetical protein
MFFALSACSGSDATTDGDETIDGDAATDGDSDEPLDGDVLVDGDVTCQQGLIHSQDGTTVLFDYSKKAAMYDAPYPNDWFRSNDGYIRMPGFLNPRNNSLIEDYLALVETELDGFSPNAPVYFRFDAALDPASLPQDPEASLAEDSALMIVNVDEDSPEYGRRTPVEWSFTEEGTDFQPGMLLAIAPMSGFPLLPGTTYAVLVMDTVLDLNGDALGLPATLADILSGCGDQKLADIFYPLLKEQLSQGVPSDLSRVRAATVFTTSSPVEELQTIRDYVASEYPGGNLEGELIECHLKKMENDVRVWWFEGRYLSPNFQSGDAPYANEGGEILFDPETGEPIVQKMEELQFSLAIPDGPMPESGWPVAMISHGTGGDYDLWVRGNRRTILQEAGIAGLGIAQPLHGERGNFLADTLLEMYSFNFLNPGAARSNFRQSAIDTFALTAFLKSGKFVIDKSVCTDWPSADKYDGPDVIRFDPERIYFHGHSQGGLTGSLAAAVEQDVKAWVLSGAGGKMTLTIMERKNPDILGLVEAMVGVPSSELHEYHPLFMLIQTLVDITDPVNYAPQWLIYPPTGLAQNLMVTTGFLDPYTPKSTAAALAVAARLPLIEPVAESVEGLDILGLSAFSRPASRTIRGPDGHYATAGFCQYPKGDHFPIFDDDDAIQMYQEFLRSAAYGDVPVLGY